MGGGGGKVPKLVILKLHCTVLVCGRLKVPELVILNVHQQTTSRTYEFI